MAEGMPDSDRIYNVSKRDSPVWRGFNNYMGGGEPAGLVEIKDIMNGITLTTISRYTTGAETT